MSAVYARICCHDGLYRVLQAAQRQLQQRLEAVEQLQQDVESLKSENLEAWRQKYDLEGQLATVRANMEGMQGQAGSMQQVRLPDSQRDRQVTLSELQRHAAREVQCCPSQECSTLF